MKSILMAAFALISALSVWANPIQYGEVRKLALKNCIDSSGLLLKAECKKKWCEIDSKNKDCQGIQPQSEFFEISQMIPLSIDHLVTHFVITDTVEYTRDSYCYFVYQGVITTSQVEPLVYSLAVKGNSLASSNLGSYRQWINKDKKGRNCAKLILNELGMSISVDELQAKFLGKKYLIFLNPYALLSDGAGEKLSKNIQIAYNHERLHIIFAENKALRSRIKKIWDALSSKEQSEFKKQHPSYNFTNSDVLLREFFSYTYESTPTEGELLFIRTPSQRI